MNTLRYYIRWLVRHRTPENCRLVSRMVNRGMGAPEQRDGKCQGYGGDTDEPCEICKRCKWQDGEE